MNINFPPMDEAFIKSRIDSGYYSNATELVRDAVRRLREDEERKARFLAAVRLGEEQIERGESVPYTGDLLDKLAAQAIENAHNKKPIKDAVKPRT